MKKFGSMGYLKKNVKWKDLIVNLIGLGVRIMILKMFI